MVKETRVEVNFNCSFVAKELVEVIEKHTEGEKQTVPPVTDMKTSAVIPKQGKKQKKKGEERKRGESRKEVATHPMGQKWSKNSKAQ